MSKTSEYEQSIAPDNDIASRRLHTFIQIGRYILLRLAVILLTLIVGVYIAIIVANLGGYIDEIVRDRINNAIMGALWGGWLHDIQDIDLRNQIIAERRLGMETAAGLYDPFLLRCLRWLYENMTFQWNDASVSEALPNTLLLFGTASLLLFLPVSFSPYSLPEIMAAGWIAW